MRVEPAPNNEYVPELRLITHNHSNLNEHDSSNSPLSVKCPFRCILSNSSPPSMLQERERANHKQSMVSCLTMQGHDDNIFNDDAVIFNDDYVIFNYDDVIMHSCLQ